MSAPNAEDAIESFELDPTEHMLLWSFRAMAIGRGDCPMLRAVFQEACGPLADQALTALFVLVKQLGWRGRRGLRLHAPGCRAISGDEMLVLAAFSAAQEAQAGGDGWRLTERLSRLMGAAPEASMEASAKMVGYLLALNGRRLPSRNAEVDARPHSAEILELRPASRAMH
jgi:hypothetical protein